MTIPLIAPITKQMKFVNIVFRPYFHLPIAWTNAHWLVFDPDADKFLNHISALSLPLFATNIGETCGFETPPPLTFKVGGSMKMLGKDGAPADTIAPALIVSENVSFPQHSAVPSDHLRYVQTPLVPCSTMLGRFLIVDVAMFSWR